MRNWTHKNTCVHIKNERGNLLLVLNAVIKNHLNYDYMYLNVLATKHVIFAIHFGQLCNIFF